MRQETNVKSIYPRDLIGYGRKPPHARWPDGARIALQFVLNYEEGAENSVLHGDAASETFLSEIIGAQAFRARHMSMESLYEYGARAGLWRVLRAFESRRLPLTVFAVALALAAPSRGTRGVPGTGPRDRQPRPALDQLPGRQTRRPNARTSLPRRESCAISAALRRSAGIPGATARTRAGSWSSTAAIVYDADSYADDLPYWTQVEIIATGTRNGCRIWSCRTRSTPTTCASPPRRASIPARSSSTI